MNRITLFSEHPRELHRQPADEHRQPRRAEGDALSATTSTGDAPPPLSAGRSAAAPAAARWALLAGNFAIGCGVMSTAGILNDIVRSLQVSVALAGQLIGVAAIVMAIASPLLAALLSGIDRRWSLVAALLWVAIGHGLSAAMPTYATLLVVRCLTMFGAAAFVPQAASAITALASPTTRGQAITFILLGWSLASVLGMPLAAWIGEALGWRWAFGAVGLLSLAAAAAVARAVPVGIKAPALSLADRSEEHTSELQSPLNIVC